MGYESSPACQIATHCLACGKALVDAASVEAGMGPDCRKKYLRQVVLAEADLDACKAISQRLGVEWADEPQTMANRLVHFAACNQQSPLCIDAVVAVKHLGWTKLAERCMKRLTDIQVWPVRIDGAIRSYEVKTPYDPTFVERTRTIPGRRWVKESKLMLIPVSGRDALFDALKEAFSGAIGSSQRGHFRLA